MSVAEKIASWIPGFIRHDFYRKLFAVLFALIIYLIAKSDIDQTRQTTVSGVEVRFELPEKVEFQTRKPPEIYVTLTVEGRSSAMERLRPDDFTIVKKIQLENVEDGIVRIDPSDVVYRKWGYNTKLKISDVSPNSFKLNLDSMGTKTDIPIEPVLDTRELPTGYRLVEATLPEDQKTVTVFGPKRLIEGIKKVATERIPLSKVTQDFNYFVSLQKLDPAIQFSFDKVMVKGMVAGLGEREFSAVPVQLLMKPSSNPNLVYELEPSEVRIIVEAPTNQINSVEKNMLHPYVDVSGLEGRTPCVLNCWIDRADAKIKLISPEKVTVTVKGVPPAEKK